MSATTVLGPERVKAIFMSCLFKESEDTTNHVSVEGVSCNVGFNPERLESHRAEIEAMLAELPNEFQETGGGGMSFLNACNDKHGNQWTGLHQCMEMLFQLGGGIGKVKSLVPQEMWPAMPGGMPYYVVTK